MLRGKYLCRSRGAIFRLHSYFGFHYSEFFPQGPRSYLCTMLDGFSLLFSVLELLASRHTPRTSLHPLNKSCALPASSGTSCADCVLEVRRLLYFGLASGFRNLFILVTSTSPLVGWSILFPQKKKI